MSKWAVRFKKNFISRGLVNALRWQAEVPFPFVVVWHLLVSSHNKNQSKKILLSPQLSSPVWCPSAPQCLSVLFSGALFLCWLSSTSLEQGDASKEPNRHHLDVCKKPPLAWNCSTVFETSQCFVLAPVPGAAILWSVQFRGSHFVAGPIPYGSHFVMVHGTCSSDLESAHGLNKIGDCFFQRKIKRSLTSNNGFT